MRVARLLAPLLSAVAIAAPAAMPAAHAAYVPSAVIVHTIKPAVPPSLTAFAFTPSEVQMTRGVLTVVNATGTVPRSYTLRALDGGTFITLPTTPTTASWALNPGQVGNLTTFTYELSTVGTQPALIQVVL